MSEVEEAIQLIRLNVVLGMTGLSKISLYEAISANEFPKNVKISERSSAWVRQEVLDWIQSKIEAREVSK
ncbi:MAG: AlpA family phage regulatory protein [Methylococcaceae bacterium]|nr:AlpA family phage regulatory protein [Methylococcaceae bacterium]